MPVPPPPTVVVEKKRGLGCFGSGCLAVLLALVLLIALVAGVCYFGYTRIESLTSTTPAQIPTFDGGDDVYQRALQKVNTFTQALAKNQPASLELTADEINTLLDHEPDLAANNVHLFISMTGDRMKLQASVPSNLLPLGLIKDRYINGDVEFSPSFDEDTKSLNFTLHHLQSNQVEIPATTLSSIQDQVNLSINSQLQTSPTAKLLLDHAKTIEVRDGNLEIETQAAQ